VARRQGRVAWHGEERSRVGVDDVRAIPADAPAQEVRRGVGDQDGREHPGEDRRPPPHERGEGTEQRPDQAHAADV
jgi:hypothetical protein